MRAPSAAVLLLAASAASARPPAVPSIPMTTPPETFDAAAWAAALEKDREKTRAQFRDGRASPYAAVARHDFAGGRSLHFGSAPDCDARLDGLAPHHLRIQLDGDSFRAEALDPGATLRAPQPGGPRPAPEVREATVAAGAKIEAGRYVLRLSHQNFPAVLVLDPQSPRLAEGPPPVWFPPDPAFRVEAVLVPDQPQREELVLSTRGNRRRALRLGKLVFALGGRQLQLVALRLLEPGAGEARVSIFFRDRTTGHQSYPVGRYVEAEPIAARPGHWLLDFNEAYNPTCAFSQLYNCPIPPRENVLAVAVRAGERDPGAH